MNIFPMRSGPITAWRSISYVLSKVNSGRHWEEYIIQ